MFADNKVLLTRYKIDDFSPLIGKSLTDTAVFNKANILVAAVERNYETIIPKGDFVFKKMTISILSEKSIPSTYFYRKKINAIIN